MSDHFTEAYEEVMSGVGAAEPAIAGLIAELHGLFLKGASTRDAVQVIDRWLPDGTWRWPEFEAQRHDLGDWSAAETLWHRIARLAYSFRDTEAFNSNREFAPYKLFSPVMDDRTPQECQGLNGTVRRYDDKFWSGRNVPCERLDCRCTWIQLSKRDVERLRDRR